MTTTTTTRPPLLLLLLLLLAMIFSRGNGKTLIVPSATYQNFTSAILAAESNDVIELAPSFTSPGDGGDGDGGGPGAPSLLYECFPELLTFSNLTITVQGGYSSTTNNAQAAFDCHGKGRALNLNVVNLQLEGIIFTGGSAAFGGAVNLVGTQSLVVVGCTFWNNTATGNSTMDGGGGLYISTSSTSFLDVYFLGSVFFSNGALGSWNGSLTLSPSGGGMVIAVFNQLPTTRGGVVGTLGEEKKTGIPRWRERRSRRRTGKQHPPSPPPSDEKSDDTNHFSARQTAILNESQRLKRKRQQQSIPSASFEKRRRTIPTPTTTSTPTPTPRRSSSLPPNVFGIFVSGGYFSYNSAIDGGAMSIVTNSPIQNYFIELADITFANNSAADTGGALVVGTGNVQLESIGILFSNLSFTGNSGSGEGGGMAIAFPTFISLLAIDLADISCAENSAGQTGGCIAILIAGGVDEANFILKGGHFVDNFGNELGGAVSVLFIEESLNTNITFLDGYYFGNNGRLGGGISVEFQNSSNCQTFVNGGIFVDNNVFDQAANREGEGGAISVITVGAATNSLLVVENCQFIDNLAVAGGAVSMFFDNDIIGTQLVAENNMFSSNVAAQGGAWYLVLIGSCIDSSFVFSGQQFATNYALFGVGGAMAFLFFNGAQNSSIVVASSIFSQNSGNQGGAFSMQLGTGMSFENLLVQVVDSQFTANYAANPGGAIAIIAPPGTQRLADCLLCTAQNLPPPGCGYPQVMQYCGGTTSAGQTDVQHVFVPFLQSTEIRVANSTFRENHATCDGCAGGAVFIANGKVHLGNLEFVGNIASLRGGALFITGTAEVHVLEKISFQGNTAASQTDMVINSKGSVNFSAPVDVLSFAPPQFSVMNGNFESLSLIGTGAVTVGKSSMMTITCPPGFQIVNTSMQGRVLAYSEGWPNLMLTTSDAVVCNPCSIGTYSLDAGSLTIVGDGAQGNTVLNSVLCRSCPFGGNCDSGMNVVLALPGFWGTIASSSSSSGRIWTFSRCPSSYCCSNPQGCVPAAIEMEKYLNSSNNNDELKKLDPDQPSKMAYFLLSSSCAFGRNGSVPLCGSCLEGYSQNMRGKACSLNVDCVDGVWMWPMLVIIAIGWTIMVIVTSEVEARKRLLRHAVKGTEPAVLDSLAWIVPVLMFFFQNVSLIYSAAGSGPQQKNALATDVAKAVVMTIANMHLSGPSITTPSSSSSSSNVTAEDAYYLAAAQADSHPLSRVCVLESLSTEGAIFLNLALPACAAGVLGVLYILLRLLMMQRRKTTNGQHQQLLLGGSASTSSLGSTLHSASEARSMYYERYLAYLREMQRRFGPSLLKLVMLFYSSIASVTGSLLHCVPINGLGEQKSVVFQAGGVECYTYWQGILWIVYVAVVLGLPVAIIAVQVWIRRKKKRFDMQRESRRRWLESNDDGYGGDEDGQGDHHHHPHQQQSPSKTYQPPSVGGGITRMPSPSRPTATGSGRQASGRPTVHWDNLEDDDDHHHHHSPYETGGGGIRGVNRGHEESMRQTLLPRPSGAGGARSTLIGGANNRSRESFALEQSRRRVSGHHHDGEECDDHDSDDDDDLFADDALFFLSSTTNRDILFVIEEPYRTSRWYWPSVILIERLLIAIVYSFETDPAIQGVWFTILFVVFIIIQLVASPHRAWGGDVVNIVCLCALAMTSLAMVRSGSLQEAGVTPPSGSDVADISLQLELMETIFFFLPILMTIIVLTLNFIKWKWGWDIRHWLRHLHFMKRISKTFFRQTRQFSPASLELSRASMISTSVAGGGEKTKNPVKRLFASITQRARGDSTSHPSSSSAQHLRPTFIQMGVINEEGGAGGGGGNGAEDYYRRQLEKQKEADRAQQEMEAEKVRIEEERQRLQQSWVQFEKARRQVIMAAREENADEYY